MSGADILTAPLTLNNVNARFIDNSAAAALLSQSNLTINGSSFTVANDNSQRSAALAFPPISNIVGQRISNSTVANQGPITTNYPLSAISPQMGIAAVDAGLPVSSPASRFDLAAIGAFGPAVTGGVGTTDSDPLGLQLLGGSEADLPVAPWNADAPPVFLPIDPIPMQTDAVASLLDHSRPIGEPVDAFHDDTVFLLPMQTGAAPVWNGAAARDEVAFPNSWFEMPSLAKPGVSDSASEEERWFAAAVVLLAAGEAAGQRPSRRQASDLS